jgi:hypothetical protein
MRFVVIKMQILYGAKVANGYCRSIKKFAFVKMVGFCTGVGLISGVSRFNATAQRYKDAKRDDKRWAAPDG